MTNNAVLASTTDTTDTADTFDYADAAPGLRDAVSALVRRDTALTSSEVELLKMVFPALLTGHHDFVWNMLRKRGVREPDTDDFIQDIFFRLFRYTVLRGFPRSIPAKLQTLTVGAVHNHKRARQRDPVILGPPSSGSEKPASGAAEIERVLDLAQLRRRLLPALSKEHRDVIDAVVLRELSHQEAADELGITRTTLSSRVKAAKELLDAMAVLFLPPSQRGSV